MHGKWEFYIEFYICALSHLLFEANKTQKWNFEWMDSAGNKLCYNWYFKCKAKCYSYLLILSHLGFGARIWISNAGDSCTLHYKNYIRELIVLHWHRPTFMSVIQPQRIWVDVAHQFTSTNNKTILRKTKESKTKRCAYQIWHNGYKYCMLEWGL